MWQRIQTLYLTIAVLLHGALLAGLPLMTSADSHVILARDNTIFFALILISTLDALSAIFLYKTRKLQIILGRIAIFTTMVAMGLILYKFLTIQKTEAHVTDIGFWMPLAFIVLVALANKAIMRDEEKVRSADRIR